MAGLLQLGLIYTFPSHNVAGHWQWPSLWSPEASLANVLAQTPQLPDAMALTLVGLAAAVGLRGPERWFWRTSLAVPLAAVCWLLARTAIPQAHGVGGLWPRRYLLADFYLLAATLQFGGERLRSGYALTPLRVVLLGAALLEVGRTVEWSRTPLPVIRVGEVEPLPYTKYTADLCAAATPEPTAIDSSVSSHGVGVADEPPG